MFFIGKNIVVNKVGYDKEDYVNFLLLISELSIFVEVKFVGMCIKCLFVVLIELLKLMLIIKICRIRIRSGFVLMVFLFVVK